MSGAPAPLPTRLTEKRRDEYIDVQEPAVQAVLRQQVGKQPYIAPSLMQQFTSDVTPRHIYVYMIKSDYLTDSDRARLCLADKKILPLWNTWRQHRNVDFSSLQGYTSYSDWESETALNKDRIRMTTACLLYFNCDVPKMLRWMGGPHVAAHRNSEALLRGLQGKINDKTFKQVKFLFKHGANMSCQAHSSAENEECYRAYGNHKTIEQNPEVAYKAIAKDYRQGYTLLMDDRLAPFIPHCHVTPQGILIKPGKKARIFFDSSFRPSAKAFAINDWTNPSTEPDTTFSAAFMRFLKWIWNLRATYPYEPIMLGDDDMCGAFRLLKYNPFLVAMHAFIWGGYVGMNTGLTFGDNTSPSCFQALATAREEVARNHCWFQPDIIQQAKEYLPQLKFPSPSEYNIHQLARANKDSLNHGVLDSQGQRLAPDFAMHVDDGLYGDIIKFMPRTVAASIVSMYMVAGWPVPEAPDPHSKSKFDRQYNHQRKMLGKLVDSNKMVVTLLPEKRALIIELLQRWLGESNTFTLVELARLLGTLVDASQYCDWAKARLFVLQNLLRNLLYSRYRAISRIFPETAARLTQNSDLPKDLQHRLGSLISRAQARVLWHHKQKYKLPRACRAELRTILSFMSEPVMNPWEKLIGHIVPRDPAFNSAGDASHLGMGAHIDELQLMIFVPWSKTTRAQLSNERNKEADYKHINDMEFVILLLQFVAVKVALETKSAKWWHQRFPAGTPPAPILRTKTDNKSALAWATKVSTKSKRGQALIQLFAEIVHNCHSTCQLGADGEFIAGVNNCLADFISRPDENLLDLPYNLLLSQLFQAEPKLASWEIFLPSPDLLSLISSTLSSAPSTDRPTLPKNWGTIVPSRSISLTSLSL